MRDIPRNTMIVIVAAILAASVIGAAYAYSASTVNSNNTVETHYISMTMSDDGTTPSYSDDFDFNIEWNTSTSLGESNKHNIKYVVEEDPVGSVFKKVEGLDGPTTTKVVAGDAGVVKVGQVVLTADVSHLDKGAFKLFCTPTIADGSDLNGYWYYTLKIGKTYSEASGIPDPDDASGYSKWNDGSMTSGSQIVLKDSISKISGSDTVVVIFTLYAWAENGVVLDWGTAFNGLTQFKGSFTFKAEPVE